MANYVKFYRGTPAAFDALVTKNTDTLYFITEKDKNTGKLYLGNVLIASSANIDNSSTISAVKDLFRRIASTLKERL